MDIKRLYSAGAIVIICVIITTIQAASAAPTISVEPSYIIASEGDTFTVNITVDPDGTEISGADYILCFNNIILKAISQNKGPFLGGTVMVNEIDNPNGRVDYCEYIQGSSGVTDTGILATIGFEVRSSGVSELCFKDVTLSNSSGYEISNVAVTNGTVTSAGVQPPTPFLISGYISYENSSECNDPAVNITNLNTSKEWTAETEATSNYYRIVLASCDGVIAGETLQFNATSPDGRQSNTTDIHHLQHHDLS
jgi:hypothetical protein